MNVCTEWNWKDLNDMRLALHARNIRNVFSSDKIPRYFVFSYRWHASTPVSPLTVCLKKIRFFETKWSNRREKSIRYVRIGCLTWHRSGIASVGSEVLCLGGAMKCDIKSKWLEWKRLIWHASKMDAHFDHFFIIILYYALSILSDYRNVVSMLFFSTFLTRIQWLFA